MRKKRREYFTPTLVLPLQEGGILGKDGFPFSCE